MRAPDQSFKAELRGKRIEAIAADRNDWQRGVILGVLDRWAAHAAAEDAWTEITKASAANRMSVPPAAQFIEWVLLSRLGLERLPEVNKKGPALEARVRAQADREWKDGQIISAATKKLAVQEFSELKKRVLGRQPKFAARNRFIRMLHDTFVENCGKPLDGAVATLTQIAFGGDVTIETVRTALRQRRRREDTRPTK